MRKTVKSILATIPVSSVALNSLDGSWARVRSYYRKDLFGFTAQCQIIVGVSRLHLVSFRYLADPSPAMRSRFKPLKTNDRLLGHMIAPMDSNRGERAPWLATRPYLERAL